MSTSSFLPPVYPGKQTRDDPSTWAKVGSHVSRADQRLINSLLGQSGGIAFIIDHAIKSTADTIRSHGLTFPDDTTRFITWLRERSFSQPPAATQGTSGDDGRGTPQGGDGTTDATHVPASSGTDAAKGRTGGGSGRVGGGEQSRRDKIRSAVKKTVEEIRGRREGGSSGVV